MALKIEGLFIAWRGGRPRFTPGARERKAGFKGEDLRHPDGRWFSAEEATAWGEANLAKIKAARAAPPRRPSPAARPAAAGNTVADLLADWLGSDHVKGLRQSTRTGYRKQVHAIVTRPEGGPEPFGRCPVAAVRKPELNAFLEYQIRTRGLHMARASRAVLNAAWHWGETSTAWRLGANPAAGLRFKKPAGRVVIFSDSEITHLVATADRMGRGSIGDAVMLGLYTGQRQGDRLALLDEGLQNGRRLFRQSKTGALVAIKELPQLRLRLDAARARTAAIALARGTRPAEIVIDESTGRAYNAHTYRHVFDTVRAAAAADMPSLAGKRDQDLRDTAVTWLARAGCTLPEIAAITGHSLASIHQIMQHYLAITPELGDAAIGKLMAWMTKEGMG